MHMSVHNEWFFPRGSLTRDGFEAVVSTGIDGWQYTGIRVGELVGSLELSSAGIERLLVPLSGEFRVDHGGATTALEGRESVFEGPTDVLYVGADRGLSIRGSGRIAIAEAPTSVTKPSRYLSRDSVPVEVRGAGRDSRQVHNFGMPEVLDAGSFIVCEVITPAGNWSSYPAHKHDECLPGRESCLEEIYYFEVAPARGMIVPPGADVDPFGVFATYSSRAGEIETNAIVRTGDIALVPHGYHGPAIAAPEYDLYYLNVMAGPERERVWRASDDPAQAWIRDRWRDEPPDARLPFTAVRREGAR